MGIELPHRKDRENVDLDDMSVYREADRHRHHYWLPVLLLAIVLIGVWIYFREVDTPQRRMDRYVTEHRQALEKNVKERRTSRARGLVEGTYYDGLHPIKAYVVLTGGVVSSTYTGVYYSYDGVPVPFQEKDVLLHATSGESWEWTGEGNDRGTLWRIEGNWFGFTASY